MCIPFDNVLQPKDDTAPSADKDPMTYAGYLNISIQIQYDMTKSQTSSSIYSEGISANVFRLFTHLRPVKFFLLKILPHRIRPGDEDAEEEEQEKDDSARGKRYQRGEERTFHQSIKWKWSAALHIHILMLLQARVNTTFGWESFIAGKWGNGSPYDTDTMIPLFHII